MLTLPRIAQDTDPDLLRHLSREAWGQINKWIREPETYQERSERAELIVDVLTNLLKIVKQELKRRGSSLVSSKFIEFTLENIDTKLNDQSYQKGDHLRYTLLSGKAFRLSWLIRYNSLRLKVWN